MGAAAAVLGGVQAALTYNEASQQAKSMRAQADYMKSMAEVNSMFAQMQADDAISRGDEQARQIGQKAKQTIGAQRAGYAAQGIEVDTGSALEVQQDTAALSKMDELRIRNNAWREAWGYKIDNALATSEGRVRSVGLQAGAKSTLMTGGIQAATQFGKGIADYKGRG